MRESSLNIVQKNEILKNCFDCFVKCGLKHISMRKMCEETGMSMSSVYYWFENKEDAILSATEYGLNLIANNIVDFMNKHVGELQYICDHFSEFISGYKEQLRFIYQVIATQENVNNVEMITNRSIIMFDIYTETLAEFFGCDKAVVQQYVYLFISVVRDYVIWGNKDKMKKEIACIYNAMKYAINNVTKD